MWTKALNGSTIGANGSEGGTIVEDEEYNGSCCITLEKCKAYYAITCGIYGSMVHTAFCNESDCQKTYRQMKTELQKFIDSGCKEETFYDRFTEMF